MEEFYYSFNTEDPWIIEIEDVTELEKIMNNALNFLEEKYPLQALDGFGVDLISFEGCPIFRFWTDDLPFYMLHGDFFKTAGYPKEAEVSRKFGKRFAEHLRGERIDFKQSGILRKYFKIS